MVLESFFKSIRGVNLESFICVTGVILQVSLRKLTSSAQIKSCQVKKKMAACEKNRTIIEDLESCDNVCSEVHTFSDWVKEEEKNMARFRFSFPPGLSSHSGIWESKVKNY